MTIRSAILATIAYHDIFKYPLTQNQIYELLIGRSAKISAVKKALADLEKQKKILSKKGLYYLKGRGELPRICSKRQKSSVLKFKKALFYARILRFIPTVNLVAISGALAMNNADANDDIDLVIVSSSNTLFTTRLLANILLQHFRRKPGQPHTKDKACLNLFLDNISLKIRTQNLYTAHEVAQMRPIWQRGKTYYNFVKTNSWVQKYLPNWQPYQADSFNTYPQSWSLVSNFLSLIEPFSKAVQLLYMKRRITTELIGDHQLFFHPSNISQWVHAHYELRLKALKLPREILR